MFPSSVPASPCERQGRACCSPLMRLRPDPQTLLVDGGARAGGRWFHPDRGSGLADVGLARRGQTRARGVDLDAWRYVRRP